MKTAIIKIIARHRSQWTQWSFVFSALYGFLALCASLVLNYFSGVYATERASNAVTDIILSNIRVFDVDNFFVYGTLIFWIFIAALCFLDPKKIPFTFKSIALFVLIRSLFVSLTHIGPFPTHIIVDSDILKKFVFDGDLFFSGHVGLPFLMALVFWKDIFLRLLFIAAAVFFGVVVLLGHLHYSIDVLAAFFITHTIYYIAENIFVKDKEIFASGINN